MALWTLFIKSMCFTAVSAAEDTAHLDFFFFSGFLNRGQDKNINQQPGEC